MVEAFAHPVFFIISLSICFEMKHLLLIKVDILLVNQGSMHAAINSSRQRMYLSKHQNSRHCDLVSFGHI